MEVALDFEVFPEHETRFQRWRQVFEGVLRCPLRKRCLALLPCIMAAVTLVTMTQAVTHILAEVEQLSTHERAELRRAIIDRVPMSDDLTDDDFASLASEMFRSLDEEEAQRA